MRQAADGADAAVGIRADAVFPDQFARAGVQRLHDVAGVGEIDDSVVDDRRRLIGAAARSWPTPTPVADPSRCRLDLRQRAVAPGLIVAADHQPVAGIGIAQHLVGDRHVVFHFAGDREAAACGAARRSWRARLRTAYGRMAGSDGADVLIGSGGKGLRSGGRSIGFEKIGGDLEIGLWSKPSGIAGGGMVDWIRARRSAVDRAAQWLKKLPPAKAGASLRPPSRAGGNWRSRSDIRQTRRQPARA